MRVVLDRRRRASARPRRPPPTGRRGTWGRSCRRCARRRCARRDRCAAGPWRPTGVTRPGRRGRWRPCRCPARGSRWRPEPAACPASAAPRSRAAARGRWSRGGRGRARSSASSLRRGASRSARRRVLTKTSVDRCARISSSSRGWMDGQIEWRASAPAAGPPGASSTSIASPMRAMSSTGHDDLQIQLLARAGVDELDLASDAAEEPADLADSGRCVADRPMRCGSPSARSLEALEAQREVRAALGGGHGVHLVDDDVLHAAQDLARLAGEQQVQRLGRRDQDVGRRARQLAARFAAGCRRCARRPSTSGTSIPSCSRRAANADQRRPEVALDVVGERLERADVQHAHRSSPPVAARSSGDRGTTGRPPGSCPSPSARGSACAVPGDGAQPCSWAGVGAANASANQARVASLNGARGWEVGGAVTGSSSLSARSCAMILPVPVRNVGSR